MTVRLPPIRTIGYGAPMRWLAQGWSDLWRAPFPMLVYGVIVAAVSLALAYGLYVSNGAFWMLALSCGFVLVAPVLAMGPYEAGRRLEAGERLDLGRVLFVRSAFRQDVAFLAVALLVIYFFWGRMAQVVYGLSTFYLHDTAEAFIRFALTSAEGHNMLIAGTIAGGAIAYLTFVLVVVAAPMLLDPEADAFSALATSFRSVAANPGPMTLWAAIIVLLLVVAGATAFVGLTVIFPWLGLASWRAYREVVGSPDAAPAAGSTAGDTPSAKAPARSHGGPDTSGSWEDAVVSVILSVSGSDRPGLTEALARAVMSAGGNWLESHLSRLGGLYVGSVLVELESDKVEALRSAVRDVDAGGLEVRIVPAVEAPGAMGEALHLSLVGQDRPGIVRQVTAALSGLDVNIETFETRIRAEPHSGAPLFHMEAQLRLPPGLAADAVREALEDISGEIMVDTALTPAKER